MSEKDYYTGVNTGVEIYQQRAFDAEATAIRLRGLLSRAKMVLEELQHHHCSGMCGIGEDHSIIMEATNELVDELAEELGDAVGGDD